MGSSQTTRQSGSGTTGGGPPAAAPALVSGALIGGRYRVEGPIARGGMSMVYLATHTRLKRKVALKVLTSDPFNTGHARDFEERFRIEAETLAGLDHPNIVTIFDYGETDDGQFYLVMEYIDGPRSTELLRDGGLSPRKAISLVMQVSSALSYAHAQGIVHRDIKPSNILIQRDSDRVKVVDFGLVQLQDVDSALSNMGFILGSPHFMAPEQAEGLAVDARADIYAVGVLLFTALTGRYPFHGPDAVSTLAAHLNEPIPPLQAARPGLQVPALLDQVVTGCLAKLPEQRYQTMDQVLGDLAQSLGQLVQATPTTAAPAPIVSEIGDTTTIQKAARPAKTRSLITNMPPPPKPMWLLPALGVGFGALVLAVIWGVQSVTAEDVSQEPVAEVVQTAPVAEGVAEGVAEDVAEDVVVTAEVSDEAEPADVEDGADDELVEAKPDAKPDAVRSAAKKPVTTRPANTASARPPESAPPTETDALPEVRDPWAN